MTFRGVVCRVTTAGFIRRQRGRSGLMLMMFHMIGNSGLAFNAFRESIRRYRSGSARRCWSMSATCSFDIDSTIRCQR
ncbi:hypothetical protein KCP71_01690 [Salmonella enterica subsp. enterica]|nr:hypothetical protein KCP71_01690 [Salmonella enterica subsp. enterica]